MLRSPALLLMLTVVLLTPTGSALAAPKIPAAWVGVTADGPLTDQPERFAGEYGVMAAAGVGMVRTSAYWDELEPTQGGFAWGALDRVVLASAAQGMPVLPTVLRTPDWAAREPGDLGSPPRDPADVGRFLTAAVARFGPGGSLWAEHPEVTAVPVRNWQIWNEPNITRYWSETPFAPGYVGVLRAAHAALKAADPGSRTVMAGLPNKSWQALATIYRAGGRGSFDVISLHPYTGKPRNVVKLVRLARRQAIRYRDATRPIWITELSWPAAIGKVEGTIGFETTDGGQAKRLTSALRRLATVRVSLGIQKVFWYTWLSEETGPSSFGWCGLRRLRDGNLVSTLALRSFSREVARLRRG